MRDGIGFTNIAEIKKFNHYKNKKAQGIGRKEMSHES